MLYKFVNNTLRAHGRENHVFNYFLLGVDLVKDAMFLWKVILVVVDVA